MQFYVPHDNTNIKKIILKQALNSLLNKLLILRKIALASRKDIQNQPDQENY